MAGLRGQQNVGELEEIQGMQRHQMKGYGIDNSGPDLGSVK